MITKNREKNRFGAHVVSDIAIKVQKIDLNKKLNTEFYDRASRRKTKLSVICRMAIFVYLIMAIHDHSI
jgi:hypothetical protein